MALELRGQGGEWEGGAGKAAWAVPCTPLALRVMERHVRAFEI